MLPVVEASGPEVFVAAASELAMAVLELVAVEKRSSPASSAMVAWTMAVAAAASAG